ncbi:UDP-N-acetylmuramoyl-tripeptide--D-alanyl-D-alanine ligase [Arcanobacterium wilhelmae]|uniref:UDP-N-acetylmuramoyl-tripeptide--D-alanyl-D-alanine ligase n=1 Tax=Arcanobacterium wilhelmae TaxID=1803177 RepID=A0ABT9N9Q3_9ACTO|nr:UDP-N-acetylmuramoyl-tripeptide--D-alanyl-D-alanine ligase [Arcanobacterium wilhelmae]MDP9800253.1 UDP-N-acetylmuramoyl-tripeptide--D-alanyl-D-alanine ligase [Arcanobacterium wilhelmae]WFN89692.1 UDP-N-acetylmuramoyl-tripeptide--D-alanyl-D-alanine ligase [Arcanobacterium wilhelmae]
MIQMTLGEVARAVGASVDSQVVVTGVATDNRKVRGGDLFIAIKGERADGNAFAGAALEAGAAGVLTSDAEAAVASGADRARVVEVPDVVRALGDLASENLKLVRQRGRGDFRVVAVTGSVGKTTTKDLLAAMLAERGEIIAPPGSFNNELGMPLTVLRADENTATLVLEMGADHIGNIEYLTSIAMPDVAVVLIVARAHLGEFGGIENVAKAKSELVVGTAPNGVVVLNADDPRVLAMAQLAHTPVVTFSREGDADVVATDIEVGPDSRASFTLHAGGDEERVSLRLVGAHHVANALAATAASLQLEIPFEHIVEVLNTAGPVSAHRMDVFQAQGMTIIDDSYNANPDSMRAGIDALAHIGAGKRTLAVLGSMLELGEASEAEHRAIGEYVADRGIDVVVGVGDETAPLVEAARERGLEASRADAQSAGSVLSTIAAPGDVVLLKGSNGSRVWTIADKYKGN